MIKLFAFFALCAAFVIATSSAEARHRYRSHGGCYSAHCDRCLIRGRHGQCYQHYSRHRPRHLRHYASRHLRYSMPSDCWRAAAMGGPCGCFAEWLMFNKTPHVLHGWNLWLAQTWAEVFPRTEPQPGAAAVWPHRHVAVIVKVHNDKTGKAVAITTRESWGERRVSLAGLVIVQPPGLYRRAPGIRYPSGTLG